MEPDPEDVAYVRQMDVDGDIRWVLFDADGDPIVMSEHLVAIDSFAASRDIKVLRVQ